MVVVPLKAEHIFAIDIQNAQSWMTRYLTMEQAKLLETTFAYSMLAGDEVIGCGGLVEVWPDRAIAWSYISRHAGPYFKALHKVASRMIEQAPYRRIEIEVAAEHTEGHRWAKMLGFELEAARMRHHRPDGGDAALYARIK